MFFTYDHNNHRFDLSFDEKNWLTSAVISSFFTEKEWWASEISGPIGSNMHLMKREKLSNEIFDMATEQAKDALKWLIQDDIISDVKVYPKRNVDSLLLELELTGTHEPRILKNVFQIPLY